jgi:hypothetical protein
MVAKKETAKKEKIAIPLEWYVPEGMMTPLAFNMTVQTIEDVFKVSFFEVKPPIQTDESAPHPSKVRADCVASVFITPDKLAKFIEVLQKQLDNYKLKNK